MIYARVTFNFFLLKNVKKYKEIYEFNPWQKDKIK